MRNRRKAIIGAILFVLLAGGITASLWRGNSQQAAVDRAKIDLDWMIAFAQRCNDCYHDHETFIREYGPQIQLGEFPISGLRIYLDADPKGGTQWVILRGTANLPDVIEDLEFAGENEHELGIQVHAGFNKSLQECLPWVIQRLDPNRPVQVTGHSLGGAVAVLLMATLEHRGFKDVSGVTFGQPKLTDADGIEHLAHLNLLRVVHEADPVPMLPPVFVEVGEIGIYHHSGPELVINADGRTTHLTRHTDDRFDVRRYWADMRNLNPIDHDMTKGYLPALKLARELGQIAPANNGSPNPSSRPTPTAAVHTLIVINSDSGKTTTFPPGKVAEPLAPCSTFKIVNTLIGIETGILTAPDQVFYQWDGIKRSLPAWNNDLTLKEAFQTSCVPAFQDLARRIGPEQMQLWLDRIDYGDRDISAGIDVFWLPAKGRKTILISPEQQAEFIRKLITGKLPVRKETVAVLRELMFQDSTTARSLYGKTGSGTDDAGNFNLGWFVGFVESGQKTCAFACVARGHNIMSKDARKIVESTLSNQPLP